MLLPHTCTAEPAASLQHGYEEEAMKTCLTFLLKERSSEFLKKRVLSHDQ